MSSKVKITLTAVAELIPEWYEEENRTIESMIEIERENATEDPQAMIEFILNRGDDYVIEIEPCDEDEDEPV